MSDFDREAEREKLREKYERDKQKREASERMSELLLQGATMTNRHCPECHSPVFRYEGKQFCPTCQKEVTGEEDAGSDGEETEQTTASETDDGGPETEGPTAPDGSDQQGELETETDRKGPSTVPEGDSERTAVDAPAPSDDRRPARVDPPARGDRRAGRNDRRETEYHSEDGEEFRDAEASLSREIGALTRKAEETRDIGRKRDLLAAAREAAETLQAIRRL